MRKETVSLRDQSEHMESAFCVSEYMAGRTQEKAFVNTQGYFNKKAFINVSAEFSIKNVYPSRIHLSNP